MYLEDNIKIFAGSYSTGLTAAVCNYLQIPLGGAKVEKFPDSE